MKLNTKLHGLKEYTEEDIIVFKKGIPGFENLRDFILFPLEDNPIFYVLQSIENEDIGLIGISPFDIEKDYEFEVQEDSIKDLKINCIQDLKVLNIVTLNSDIKKITVNLRAPIIINIKQGLGEQIILNTEKYEIKHPLIKE